MIIKENKKLTVGDLIDMLSYYNKDLEVIFTSETQLRMIKDVQGRIIDGKRVVNLKG